jgi:uncharacterized protein with HEPN domain
MSRLSNIIRHVYDDLKIELIWITAKNKIQPVRRAAFA